MSLFSAKMVLGMTFQFLTRYGKILILQILKNQYDDVAPIDQKLFDFK